MQRHVNQADESSSVETPTELPGEQSVRLQTTIGDVDDPPPGRIASPDRRPDHEDPLRAVQEVTGRC